MLPTTIDPDDIDENLEQRHRDAMLDVVLLSDWSDEAPETEVDPIGWTGIGMT